MRRYCIDGETFERLPAYYKDTCPINERWWIAHGGTIIDDDEEIQTGGIYDVATIKDIFEAENREWHYLEEALDDVGVLDKFNASTVVNTALPDTRLLIEQVKARFIHRWTFAHVLHLGWEHDDAKEQAENIWEHKVERVRLYAEVEE